MTRLPIISVSAGYGTEGSRTPMGALWRIYTSRFSSRLTSGLSSTPRTSVKMAALAPIPSASVRITMAARLLLCINEWNASLKSRKNDMHLAPLGRLSVFANLTLVCQTRALPPAPDRQPPPCAPTPAPRPGQRPLAGVAGMDLRLLCVHYLAHDDPQNFNFLFRLR